jgi:hypothetical protein
MWKKTMKTYMYYVTYANINMEKTWQGYDARSCLRLVLNKLKEMKGLISIYTPIQDFYVCIKVKKLFENLLNWESIMS